MDKTESVGFQIGHLAKLMRSRMQQKEVDAGADEFTATYGWILGYLYCHQNQDIYQKDLESEFHMARSTITGIVKNMEQHGYIKRIPVARDARLKKLELTTEGKKFHETTHIHIEETEMEVCEGISQEDMQVFFRVIEKMRDNMKSKERRQHA